MPNPPPPPPPPPSALPLSAMDPPPHPLSAVSSFLHHHLHRLGAEFSARLDDGRRLVSSAAAPLLPLAPGRWGRHQKVLPFAAVSANGGGGDTWQPRHAFDIALAAESVAKTLAGTSVFTVSNANNEFVLISDPASVKSLGLLCFRQEDAEALLAQVQLRQPVLGKAARVVPITLDQVYMLKVEGIAFRFLPDPIQIRSALELKAGDTSKGFDGVPVFQSDLLVIKKKNKRYYPIYFQKVCCICLLVGVSDSCPKHYLVDDMVSLCFHAVCIGGYRKGTFKSIEGNKGINPLSAHHGGLFGRCSQENGDEQ